MTRGKRARIAAAMVIGLTLIGCSVSPKKQASSPDPAPVISASAVDSPTPVPTTPPPVATPARTETVAPPAKPSPTPEPTPLGCKTVDGKPQSAKKVLALLTAASKVNEYQAAGLDPTELDRSLNGKLPNVHIPLRMLKAVAADESSWTSTCVSGDGLGGYGTMQMQPDATDTVNLKFQVSFDRTDQSTNILLGNAYLEYLTVHFGILYFKNDFNLTTNYPLRDAVLAAYNVGPNVIEQSSPTAGPPHIGPQGTAYYQTVVALMGQSAACQTKWGK